MDSIPVDSPDWEQFREGIDAPNTTPAPDIYYDWVFPFLPEAELRVLLYLCRRTFGFKKLADTVSVEQFMSGIVAKDGRRIDCGTGLSRSSVIRALRGLREKHLVIAEQQYSEDRGQLPTNYHMNLRATTVRVGGSPDRYGAPPLTATDTPPVPPAVLPPDRQRHPQEDSNTRNSNTRDSSTSPLVSRGLDLSKGVQSPFIGATAPQPIFQDSLIALPAPKKAARKRPATDRAWPEWAIAWLAGFMAQMGWGDGTKAETKNRILLAVANDLESKTDRQRADFLRYLFSDDKIKNSHEWVTRNVQQALEAWLAEGMPATRSKAAPPSFSSGYRGKPGGKNEWEEVYNETRRKEGEESRKTECPECWCPQGWHSNQCSLWTEGTIRCDPITNPWRKAKADEKRKELAAYREAAMQRKDYLR